MNCTESFLYYNCLPDDESALVDLKKAAVTVMSHLDRLAAPYNPPAAFCKVGCSMFLFSVLKMMKTKMFSRNFRFHLVVTGKKFLLWGVLDGEVCIWDQLDLNNVIFLGN